MGKLYAIADLHLGHKANLEALSALHDRHREDGLILAGDLGERDEHLRAGFRWATAYFKTVWWCPGNHELYTMPGPSPTSSSSSGAQDTESAARGEAKYDACVAVAREYGVLTPEDPFAMWEGEDGPAIVCPVFTLYDYSFAPEDTVRAGREVEWAAEKDIIATDEALLHPDPYPTRKAWCEALVDKFELRLDEAAARAEELAASLDAEEEAGTAEKTAPSTENSVAASTTSTTAITTSQTAGADAPKRKRKVPLIIANHWPLLERLVYLPAIPRFRIWCGTRRTAAWHTRFGAAVVVSGHLHIRRTDWVDGVRFEECSLGYPRQWQRARDAGRDINAFLREILPGPAPDDPNRRRAEADGTTKWWIYGDA